MESQNIEYRAVIKFLTKEAANAIKSHRCMADVYGDSSPKYSTVANWSADVKRVRDSLEDDPRPGRPADVISQDMLDRVERLVLKDRRVKVAELASQCVFSNGSVYTIIHEHIGITSKTKREQWVIIHDKFIACSGTQRSIEELEKKTNNLIQKHRNIYTDYKRCISQTGGGPSTKSLSFLTEAVMAVVGKEGVSVTGVGVANQTDSTMISLADNRYDHQITDVTFDAVQEVQHEEEKQSPLTSVMNKRSTHCEPVLSHCSLCCKALQETLHLKKRKLELEIELLQKKLKEENLGGDIVPTEWQGGLKVTYRFGDQFNTTGWKAHIKVSTRNQNATTYNAIGVIRGSVEPG